MIDEDYYCFCPGVIEGDWVFWDCAAVELSPFNCGSSVELSLWGGTYVLGGVLAIGDTVLLGAWGVVVLV